MLLHEPIDQMAATDPRRPASPSAAHTLSFGEFSARTTRAAALGIAAARGSSGDHRREPPELGRGVLRRARAGRILTFLNHRLAAAELAAIVERAGARVVVGPRAELDRIAPSVAALVTARAAPTYIDLDEWASMRDGEQPGAVPGPVAGGGVVVPRHADLVDLHQWDDRIAQGRDTHPSQRRRISGRQRVRASDRT